MLAAAQSPRTGRCQSKPNPPRAAVSPSRRPNSFSDAVREPLVSVDVVLAQPAGEMAQGRSPLILGFRRRHAIEARGRRAARENRARNSADQQVAHERWHAASSSAALLGRELEAETRARELHQLTRGLLARNLRVLLVRRKPGHQDRVVSLHSLEVIRKDEEPPPPSSAAACASCW